MLAFIEFENYRIFSKKQCLKIAPLTVIFGKNNTGKSAVLRLPMIVRSAIHCDSDEVFSKTDTNGLVLCDEYRDVVYGKGNHAVGLKFGDTSGEVSVDLKMISENQAGTSHSRLEEIIVQNRHNSIAIRPDDDGIYRDSESFSSVSFYGITPQDGLIREKVKTTLQKLDLSIDYIGPVRWIPERYFPIMKHPEGLSGIDGKNAYSYLIQDSQNVSHPLLDNVSKWYEDNFCGWKVEVGKSRYPVFSVELSNENLPSNNICDTGFGIQQSLPIVISAYRKYDTPTLVILEEPESHLNPYAHAQMGELLATSAVSDRSKCFLVETHSLNLMIRLRTLIAKGEIKRDDVALYYVEYDESTCSSNLRQVLIDEKGDVKNWPEEMFKETLSEALALRQAQMSKQ